MNHFSLKKFKKKSFSNVIFGGSMYEGLKIFFGKQINQVNFFKFFEHNLLAFKVTNQ